MGVTRPCRVQPAVAAGSWGGRGPSLAGYVASTGATRGPTAAVTSAAWGVPGGAVSENGRLRIGDEGHEGAAAAREGAPRPRPAPLAELRPAALAPDLGVSDSVRGTYGHPRPRPGSAFAPSDTQGVRPDRSQMCRAPRPDERPSRSCPPPKT